MSKPIHKILVVDDSSLIRRAVSAILDGSGQFRIVGEAVNGAEALAMIPRLKPDLITLDIIMPGMSGLTTLKHIMIFYPTPVVMLSGLTREGADITFDALRYGAIDFIAKPAQLDTQPLRAQADEIVQKMLTAVKVRTSMIQYVRLHSKPLHQPVPHEVCRNIVVIGVAEGGYGSLLKIIPRLKPHPATVYMVVFYDIPAHVDNFIEYLRRYSAIEITRVRNNTGLRGGTCYVSLGEEYVTVHGEQGTVSAHVSQAPFSSRRGSIDMLMFSVAETAGRRALGVILTGAGGDGAEGLEEIIRVGGGAIIQAPISCLHKGMPLAALNACEAEVVVADMDVAAEINYFLGHLHA